jgi:hypothetical protein
MRHVVSSIVRRRIGRLAGKAGELEPISDKRAAKRLAFGLRSPPRERAMLKVMDRGALDTIAIPVERLKLDKPSAPR